MPNHVTNILRFTGDSKTVQAMREAVTYTAVTNRKAESYVGEGVKILIAVVIGALLLTLLYTLFNTTIMPTVTSKITDLFSKTPNIT